jgi:hypothetical protein
MRRIVCLRVVFFAAMLFVAGSAGASPPGDAKAVDLNADPHLVAWWKLDETSGKTAADSSGRKHDGVLERRLAFDSHHVAGQPAGGLKFDGDDSSVRIPGFKGIAGTRPRTIAAWIKTMAISGEIVSWGSRDHGQAWIFGQIRYSVGVTPGGGYLYMKPGLDDNAWHHLVAVVRDAALPNLHDDVKLYKDGGPAEIDDIGLLDLWPVETGQTEDVRIGRRWKGLIRDLRIYDRALSDREVETLFSTTRNGLK